MTPEPVPSGETQPVESGQVAPREGKKKKKKARSAWISFFGRVVAQLVGAVATVVLGLYLIHKTQPFGPGDEPGSEAAKRVAAREADDEAARPARTPGETALAVLPMQNFSAGAEEEYLADGMTEALIAGLAQIDGLRVVSRTSSMHYKAQRKPLPEIARELAVDLVVEGSIVKVNGRIRITAQLIDAASDVHLWAHTYDRPVKDVLSLQSEIASEIARQVKASLTPSSTVRRAANR